MKKILLTALVCFVVIASFRSVTKTSLSFHQRNEFEKEKGCSDALQALDFWSRSRAYPDTDIPRDKYFKEFQRDKIQFKRKLSGVNSNNGWQSIGPGNVRGRTLSVAVNPHDSNTVYAGTASGGLWRSHTMGFSADWQRIPLGYPALGISSIVIDPIDTNVIYIGTGEVYSLTGSFGGMTVRTTRGSYGIGILKTTNGGQTWTKSLDWSFSQQTGIQKIIMNPYNHHSLWATTTQGLYVSRDGGVTWNLNFLTHSYNVVDIIMTYSDTNKIMISAGNFSSPGTGVYKTIDGGDTWIPVSGIAAYSGKTMLGITQANSNIIYASVADTVGEGSLMKSTDFGDTWDTLHSPIIYVDQGWYSHIIAVQPLNPNLICYGSVTCAYSQDGGSTFHSSYAYADYHGYTVDPSNPNVLYIANDGGIFRSPDFGVNFTDVGAGMITSQFYNGFSCSLQDSAIAFGHAQDHNPGYIYSGTTTFWNQRGGDEVGWTAIDPTNDKTLYSAERNGIMIIKSFNGGVFGPLQSFSGVGSWNAPLVIDQAAPSVLYFADIKVYKTTTSGASWTATNGNNEIDGNPAVSMTVAPTNPDTIYVGNAPVYSRARVWRSTNGGTSWTDVSTTLPDRYPLDIAIDPTNSRITYVVFGGFGSGKIFKTSDVGATWTDITGTLPDVPTTAVAIDPLSPNTIYVGNDLSVYSSTDGGITWNAFGDGLPEAVIVSDLVISPFNHALKCVTHGNGVYERPLLQMQSPAQVILLSPSDNDSDHVSPVTLSWLNSETAIYYQLQVSTSSSFNSFLLDLHLLKDTTYTLSSLTLNTRYYWRVRAMNSGGWGEFSSAKFTIPNLPSQVNTLFPPDRSTQIEIPTQIKWHSQHNITSYEFQLMLAGSNVVLDSTLVDTSITIPWLNPGTVYSWRVRAQNIVGWGSFNTVKQFTTWTLPATSSLVFPEDHSMNVRSLRFQWNTSQGALVYDFQLATSPSFDSLILHDSTLSSTSDSVSRLDTGLTYYWRVRARNSAGFGNYSDVRSFRVAELLASQTFILHGWNLISVPVFNTILRKSSLYPSSVSSAFGFSNGYIQKETLKTGAGYWLKFSAAQSIGITGLPEYADSFFVTSGWNLVGSISTPVPVGSITSIPAGIVTTEFFGYNKGYTTADTITPGQGYWVKVNQTGKLFLSRANVFHSSVNNIRIIPTSELPPVPPGSDDANLTTLIPQQFILGQNYPNPFNPTTNISFQIAGRGFVTLNIYNLLGEELSTLVNEELEPGTYTKSWNAGTLPSGIYIYELKAGSFFDIKKMLVVK